jgi:hypothetical protein
MICNACQQKLDIQLCDFCQQARPTPGKRSVTINVVAAGPFADEIAQLLGREADPATPLWLGNQSVTITVNAPNSSSTKNVKLVCANAADRGSPLEEQIVNGVNKLQKDSPNPQEPV